MRVSVAGSVSFSVRTIEGLLRHRVHLVGILGLDPAASASVSDYADLSEIAREAGVPYAPFRRINAPEVAQQLNAWAPDLLFIVGLSQLAGEEILAIPSRGVIGFHPTPLPLGRGRAPIAWLTHDGTAGAASFFLITAEPDAGPLFVSEPYDVSPGVYASDVVDAARRAIDRALDRWIPRLLAGEWDPVPQDESTASYWGRRAPEDGLIDWTAPAAHIARLVRATSRPYPGAYTYSRGIKVVVWRAAVSDAPLRGVPGRVLTATNGSFVVQAGDGLIHVTEASVEGADEPFEPRVGEKLGYSSQDQIHMLNSRIADLDERLTALGGAPASAATPASRGGGTTSRPREATK